jgi:hypothetical protein
LIDDWRRKKLSNQSKEEAPDLKTAKEKKLEKEDAPDHSP